MKSTLLWAALLFCISRASAQTIKGKVYRNNSDTVVANAIIYYGGSMSNQRVGDLLPFEYQSEAEEKEWAKLPVEPAMAMSPVTNPAAAAVNPLVFEKTYLHTDRDVYAQGDTLWYKAYLVNAQNNQPINSSHNLYVELIAPDSAKIIDREIIRLDNGLGNGEIELADSLASGKYRLRAYTNWMRNFGDNFIFEKDITVLNTKAAVADGKVAAKKVAVAAKNKNKSPASATTVTTSHPSVRFYPEGGSMVQGLSSIVGVKAGDGNGRGMAVSGAILSSAGDTVSRFSCDTLGMGLFVMLPVSGQAYHAVVKGRAYDIPEALNTGLGIQVKQTDSLIRAIISTNNTLTLKPTYTIAVKHGGVTLLSQQFQPVEQQTPVKIPTATLSEGISAITVYDENNKPNCERLVYIHHANTPILTIKTDKKSYQAKEPVKVQIDVKANASLSMAVVDAGMVPEQADDIVSAFLLQSEIRGHIENARRYFDSTNVNRFKQLDMLLLTQGWRDFVWRRMADTAIHISYAAEQGVPVSGLVKDEVTEKVQPNLYVSLFANAATGDKIFTANTDASGRFAITGLQLYGKQNIKLTATNVKGEKKGSLWLDTLKPLQVNPVIHRVADTTTAAIIKAALAKREAAMTSSKLKGVTQLKEVTIKTDKKKFVRIEHEAPMMEWELQQEFNITPKDYEYKTLTAFLLNNDKRAFPQDGIGPGVKYIIEGKTIQPDIVVNGVLTPYYVYMQYPWLTDAKYPYMYQSTVETYFSLPMEKFKKVEVHQVMKADEESRLTYVIILTTKPDALTDNPGTLNAQVAGYYQARTFYAPVPRAQPSMDDYRTTIHWEPNITTNEKGEATITYYNADPKTKVRIVAEGVSDKGVPVAGTATYEVK